MIYYDIHTHKPAINPENIAIVSLDLRNRERLSAIFSLGGICISGHIVNTNNWTEYYSIGVHPWYMDKKLINTVREHAASPFVIAIGETGLDKITAKSADEFKLQQEFFMEHIDLSEDTGKPLIIHCVKAWDELLHIRKITKPSKPWIIHGFKGKAALAEQLMDAGMYLSFGAKHNADSLKAAWNRRRLLTETDDSDSDIRDIYAQIANKLNIPVKELSDNMEIFFNTLITNRR